MAVRIRLKKFGRRHRPYYRICAMDGRAPRDGRVLEELGTYDPLVPERDARAILKRERVDYWLEIGAQPTEKVGVLIKKYGTGGTHIEAQKLALDRLAQPAPLPDPGVPASLPKKKGEQHKREDTETSPVAATAEGASDAMRAEPAAAEPTAAEPAGEPAPAEPSAPEPPAE